jgi:hypothetical protein
LQVVVFGIVSTSMIETTRGFEARQSRAAPRYEIVGCHLGS